MAYEIKIEKHALKELKSLPNPFKKQIKIKISSLVKNPRPSGAKKLHSKKSIYRIRHGRYRILYFLDDKSKTVNILKTGDRKDVYNLDYSSER